MQDRKKNQVQWGRKLMEYVHGAKMRTVKEQSSLEIITTMHAVLEEADVEAVKTAIDRML